ncbi:unnamed protein product [Adineta ricciae]|uniref:Uncharacterized protein n=1 Tax=Adineta ricciae TaxID=249248 RepID=A0A815VH17_ADIRI|nr:unnamed protein product [Adineta ricciae]
MKLFGKSLLGSRMSDIYIFAAILLVVDAATGGHIKPANFTPAHKNDFSYYGHYNTDWIIPIYCVTGVAYGMVELIRRVIPRDIVGGDPEKLQRMDALVHIFYEVSGTAGAFATALGLIPRLEWSQIIVGGSNFGELLGAFSVFLLANYVKTPIPWLRLDAIMLLIIWYIPYYYPSVGEVKCAWIIAATFIPISFGWAAGDVSLAAYIQTLLGRLESKDKEVSPLGAVMAFLYSSYIIIYAIANPLLGKYIDSVYNSTGSVRPALVNTAAVQLTVISVMVFISTMIPKGAIACNPKLDDDQAVENAETIDAVPNSTPPKYSISDTVVHV